MRYINGTLVEPQIKTEDALSEPHGAITCLDNERWVLAARYTPVLYLLNGTHVISSCILVLPDAYKNPFCCGMVTSVDCKQIFILFCDVNGKLFIVQCFIENDEIIYYKDSILTIPQGLKDIILADKVVEWNQDGTTSGSLDLDIFSDGDTILQHINNFPVGPAITKYKPWLSSDGTKLFIGVNHMQIISVTYKHDVIFLDLDKFREQIGKMCNVDYAENEWWVHNRVTKTVQRTEICTGEMECDQCGHSALCNTSQTRNKKMRPVWDAHGNPILEECEFEEVIANTVLSHPVMVSSIISLDSLTGLIDGVTHIGASSIGSYAKRSTKSTVIVGLDSYDGIVDVFTGAYTKSIPISVLFWGRVPLSMDNNIKFSFFAFLEWWDKYHIPSVPMDNYQTYFDIGSIEPTHNGVFNVDDLKVSEYLCITQNNINYQTKLLTAPFNSIKNIYDITTSLYKNISYIIYNSTILRYGVAYYDITSKYDGRIIDTRMDIAIGRVIVNVPKVVECIFKNKDKVFKMANIVLKIVPDLEYSYYEYCTFSTDGVIWDYVISLPDLAPEESTTFYVNVLALTDNIDPKPVQFEADYRRCLV